MLMDSIIIYQDHILNIKVIIIMEYILKLLKVIGLCICIEVFFMDNNEKDTLYI
jgi:hypothetical protein